MIRPALLVTAAALLTVPALADTRVVAGQSVPWSAYPSVVVVDYIGAPSCTGTVVAPEWVLTAAHCLAGKPGYALSVRSVTGFAGAAEIVPHPDYQTGSYVNDVALLRLASPLTDQPAVLAEAAPLPGEAVTVTGFGRTTAAGTMSTTLQRGAQHVIGRAACSAAMEGLPVDQGRICAGASTDAGTCNGDSGGPLFDASGAQVGIVSLNRVGCPAGAPTVYASVPAYRDWIAATAGVPLPRSGWYVAASRSAEGWAVRFDGGAAFLGWFGHGAGAPAWSVARLQRNASGAYEGPVTTCPAGPDSCGQGGTVTLTATASGLRVGWLALTPFQF